MPPRQDLHPKYGARFVLTRRSETPPAYGVEVFLPAERSISTQLAWDTEGTLIVAPEVEHAGVREQLVKLARVLKRTPKARLSRWRDVYSADR